MSRDWGSHKGWGSSRAVASLRPEETRGGADLEIQAIVAQRGEEWRPLGERYSLVPVNLKGGRQQ